MPELFRIATHSSRFFKDAAGQAVRRRIFSHHRRLWRTAESFRPAGLHKTSGSRRSPSVALSQRNDWTTPQALAIPRGGYFKLEQGKYRPLFPATPACYGFTIIAKFKPGREQVIREYAKTLGKAREEDPPVLS